MPARILLPVDGARNSKTAEAYAVKLNELMPLTVTLFNVVNTKDIDGHGIDPSLKESIIDTKRRYSERAMAEAAETFKKAGIEYQKKLTSGDPSSLICYEAQNGGYDMILMAESGRTDFQDWYMGSVTNYVLYKCRVPVLLVKHERKP
jgi:nucleotide-binding universal stress UspA family protein